MTRCAPGEPTGEVLAGQQQPPPVELHRGAAPGLAAATLDPGNASTSPQAGPNSTTLTKAKHSTQAPK
jgi:hypothetical protein